jgi:hypothetical protein
MHRAPAAQDGYQANLRVSSVRFDHSALTRSSSEPKLRTRHSREKEPAMPIVMPRRSAIRLLTATSLVLAAAPPALSQQAPIPARPQPLSDDQVQRFVQAAHADLDLTRQLLDKEPRLIKATWDWGGGDFETALGGAGHMGRRDIASLLLARGAALDLFAAAMLGELSIVRAALDSRPSLARVPGPHGIPLVAHAKAGGPAAASVVEYIGVVLERLERNV